MKTKRLYAWLIKLWPLCLLILGGLLYFSFLGLDKLQMDSSNEAFMPEDDPVTQKNQEFKDIFGNEEFFYILIETEDIYTQENLTRLAALEEDLWENLPFVDDIASPYSAEILALDDGFLRVESLEEDGIPDDQQALGDIKKIQMDSLIIPGRLMAENGAAAGILVNLEEIPHQVWGRVGADYSAIDSKGHSREDVLLRSDISFEPMEGESWMLLEDPRKDTAATMVALLKDHEHEDFKLTLTGLPYIDQQVDILTTTEAGWFGLLGLTVASILLLLLFKEWRAWIAPVSVFVCTVLILFGFMGWVGIDITLLSIVIIPLILVISVGYSIHVIHQLRRWMPQFNDKKEAIKEAYGETMWPCFLTAITTAGGFVSFLFVPMQPVRELGLLCAVGAMTAFVLVMILVPLYYRIGRYRPRKSLKKNRETKWEKWNQFLFTNKKWVYLAAIVLTILSFLGALKIKPSSDMMEIVGEKAEFVQDAKYLSQRLGGAYSTEFLIEFPEGEMARRPDVLQAMVEAGKMASDLEQVSLSLSLADLVLELDRVLMEKEAHEATIPDDSAAVAQYLMFYEMAGGEALDDWTDYSYQTLRLSILLKNAHSDFDAISNDILPYLERELPPGTKVSMTGDMPVMIRMMDLVIQSQVRSCLAALFFIFLLLIIILKGFRLGVIAMIPNLLPILSTLGLMGWLGYPLDFVTAMVAPMLIGIAVDDIIHFFIHYKEKKQDAPSSRAASTRAFKSVGDALVFTSLVLCGGFILFGFSNMSSLQHMGILTSWGIMIALMSDIALSPLILERLDHKKEKEGDTE